VEFFGNIIQFLNEKALFVFPKQGNVLNKEPPVNPPKSLPYINEPSVCLLEPKLLFMGIVEFPPVGIPVGFLYIHISSFVSHVTNIFSKINGSFDKFLIYKKSADGEGVVVNCN